VDLREYGIHPAKAAGRRGISVWEWRFGGGEQAGGYA
jgi:hypothetical protein